jgi:hypothetical protein
VMRSVSTRHSTWPAARSAQPDKVRRTGTDRALNSVSHSVADPRSRSSAPGLSCENGAVNDPVQRRPSTVRRLSSIPQISSVLVWPTWLPNRLTSTAPTCSTSTRVLSPSTTISGRKLADRALRDVGATSTTDRGRNSSACTTTPNRRPCCSWPLPFGRRSSKTSPRRTKSLHQRSDFVHLLTVVLVGFE